MALENSPGPDGAYRWQSKAANKMIMGLRNGPEHGRKCKQSEPLTGLSRPLSAAQICKKCQAHIQIAATICQHGKTEKKKEQIILSSYLNRPRGPKTKAGIAVYLHRHLYEFAAAADAAVGNSARTDHGTVSQWKILFITSWRKCSNWYAPKGRVG